MEKVALLTFSCVLVVLQLATAAYVSNCLDGKQCNAVKVIAQEQHDIQEALRVHVSAQSVDLHGNLIESLPVTAFSSMNQLKTLNLSYNYLEEIQLPNNRNQKLQVVDITYNKLEIVIIPASVTNFVAIRNKLHTVNIHGSNRLNTLILSMNKFDSFRYFGNLKQIVDFDLSCNQIKEVNLNILSVMSQLRNLNLANNHIHCVSGSGTINSLQTLDLSNNILTMVDETFSSFPSVRDLNLRNNKIVLWLHNDVNLRQLRNLDVRQNDWDCKNLRETYSKLFRFSKIDREYQCEQIQIIENGICCTTSYSPYADRLIKYRKEEHDALKAGTKQIQGEIDCRNYVPNPCDGDDNKVQEVASAELVAISSVSQLQSHLQREQNTLNSLKRQNAAYKEDAERISRTQADLADYIDEVYRAANLTAPGDEVAKLDALFAHYESINDDLKGKINEKIRLKQARLEEIKKLEQTGK